MLKNLRFNSYACFCDTSHVFDSISINSIQIEDYLHLKYHNNNQVFLIYLPIAAQ